MKKILAITMVLALALSFLSACAKEPEVDTEPDVSTEPSIEPSAEPVELLVWEFSKWNGITGTESDGKPEDWMQHMADQFTEMYPNVTFNIEVYDVNEGPQKTAIALQQGVRPAIIHDALVRLVQYGWQGYLQPLDNVLTDEMKAQFTDNALEPLKANDEYYVIPFAANPFLMMVNRSLFEQAGTVDMLPSDDLRSWTFDEYYNTITETLAALDQDDIYGVPLVGNLTTGDTFTQMWFWGAGGSLFSENLKTIAIGSPDGLKGLEFFKKMLDTEGFVPSGMSTTKIGDVFTLFNQQKLLTTVTSMVNYGRCINAMDAGQIESFDVELVSMPTLNSTPVSASSGHGFAMGSQEDEDVLYYSELFLKFIATEGVPYLTASREYSYLTEYSDLYADQEDQNIVFASQMMNYMAPACDIAIGFNATRQAITPIFQQFYVGDIAAEEFAEQAAEVGDQLLQQAREEMGVN